MKVIIYVKEEVSKPFTEVVHEIRTGHSVHEDLKHWVDVYTMAMKSGIIDDFQVVVSK